MSSPQEQPITRPAVEIYGHYRGYGFAGLGVNTAIGNYTQTSMDLSFPAGLLGLLDWQRTYNSHSGAVGALGPGWATAFSARLVAGSPGEPVTLSDEDGRILTFTPADGGYRRPQDLDADLTREADGSFTLTYNSGLVWTFDADGRLTGRSLEGQRVTVDHNADDLPLRAQHSPSDRHLAFAYDGNRRLTSVQASDGRAVTFAYSTGDASSSLLESVTLPGGGMIRFGWTGADEAAQLSRVTDPDDHLIVANSFQAGTRRVIRQEFAGGSAADFGYDDGNATTTVTAAPSEARTTFEANTDGRLIKTTDAAGNASTFGYDQHGYLSEAITPGGSRLTQTHDARDNLLTSTWGGATAKWTYDEANRVTSMTDQVGGITRYTYPGSSHIPAETTAPGGAVMQTTAVNGLITSRTDADGNTTRYSYDGSSNLVATTSPRNEVTRYGYDEAGNRTELTRPSDATSHWAYDGAGRVTQFTGPDGDATLFRYSPAGLLLTETEPGGPSTHYSYDEAGNLTGVTDPLGEETTFGYDPFGNTTSITDPDGGVTRFEYNTLNQLVNVTDAMGASTTFDYDADGNNTSQRDPSGTSRTSYDPRGNPVAQTDPAGGTTRYAYDDADRLTSLTDAVGGSWHLDYDRAGNVASVTDPGNASARLTWTKAGHLNVTTDPLGRQVTFTRDPNGRVTQVTDAEGGVTRYAYDPDGRRISATTPAGLLTRYAYDKAGRRIATTDPRGWVTRTEYNSRGQRTAVISPSGATTRFRYDPAGHLTEMIDGNGSVTRYGYDNADRVISVTNPKDAITRYVYDKAGRLTSITDPLDRTTRHEYDKAGNLTAVIDPSERAQHMAYDHDGRLTRWTADDGGEVTFTYDKAGRRASMTDVTGTTHYAYDSAGHLLTVTGPDGEEIKSAYDKAGQRTSLTCPGGLTVDYYYNLNGRLVGLHDSRAGDAVYALDPDGRLLTEQFPRRFARRYHYEHGLLSHFLVIDDDHPVAETFLTHDPDGRIAAERDGDVLRAYQYDRAGQLVRAEQRDGDWLDEVHLTYDAAGNRTRLRRGETETRYRYDDADQLRALQTREWRTEFRYDSSGRLTEQIEGAWRRTIDYDGFGRPVTVTRHEPAFTERARATFDGDGLLTALVLANESEHREQERAASVRYRWNAGEQIPQILTQRVEPDLDDAEHDRPGRLNADFAYGYGRTFASWRHGAAAFHHDVYGSALRTEDTEPWVQAGHYSIFGVPEEPRHRDERWERDDDGPWHRALGLPELPRFGYRGELALGPMLDLRARDYDAGLGRFTTRDPVLSHPPQPGAAVNPYAYADNDPVNRVDPLGLFAITAAAAGPVHAVTPVVHSVNPRQANNTATATNVVQLTAAFAGGDHTTLHTAATYAASFELAGQLFADGKGTPSRISFEERIPGAPKYRMRTGQQPGGNSYGKADIFFEYLNPGSTAIYIWEVKSATIPTASTVAQNEAKWYAQAYNMNRLASQPGTLAVPGAPMKRQVYVDIPVPAFSSITVYSPPGTFGAVLYRKAPGTPPPAPVPVYQYQPQGKKLSLVRGAPVTPVNLRPVFGAAGVVVGGAAIAGGVAAGGSAAASSILDILADIAEALAAA